MRVGLTDGVQFFFRESVLCDMYIAPLFLHMHRHIDRRLEAQNRLPVHRDLVKSVISIREITHTVSNGRAQLPIADGCTAADDIHCRTSSHARERHAQRHSTCTCYKHPQVVSC